MKTKKSPSWHALGALAVGIVVFGTVWWFGDSLRVTVGEFSLTTKLFRFVATGSIISILFLIGLFYRLVRGR